MYSIHRTYHQKYNTINMPIFLLFDLFQFWRFLAASFDVQSILSNDISYLLPPHCALLTWPSEFNAFFIMTFHTPHMFATNICIFISINSFLLIFTVLFFVDGFKFFVCISQRLRMCIVCLCISLDCLLLKCFVPIANSLIFLWCLDFSFLGFSEI